MSERVRGESLRLTLAILVALATWATAFVGARYALRSYAPGPASLARLLLGALSFAYVLGRLPASRAAPLLYAVPPLTLALGWLVLGETTTPGAIAGGIVTLAGVWLVGARSASTTAVPGATTAR